MAGTPTFASTPRIGVANIAALNTARDGTGTITDILTGVAAGTRIERIVLETSSDPADSVITIFIYNGTSYFLFDEIDIGNPAAASATVSSLRAEKAYRDLVLPSASYKLAMAITASLTAGSMIGWAFGADLT
jgi:hypothetical protein